MSTPEIIGDFFAETREKLHAAGLRIKGIQAVIYYLSQHKSAVGVVLPHAEWDEANNRFTIIRGTSVLGFVNEAITRSWPKRK